MLFEPSLGLRVLDLFKGIGRTRPVVAHWPGEADDGAAWHAVPGHPEYAREALAGAAVVWAELELR